VVTEEVRSHPEVSAVPVDERGVTGGEVSAARTARLTIEDDGFPGFTESMGASAGALVTLFGVAAVLVAVAVPFSWIPLLALAGVWLSRRMDRRRERRAAAGPVPAGGDSTTTPPDGVSEL
jgi:hypothetical protein